MASYRFPILIQNLNLDTEKYENYYSTHANINKVGGKEYTQASTNISNSTFNFKVRYCAKMEEVMFNTEIYRVVYKNRCYDIKNVDHYGENKAELTITGEYNVKTYSNWTNK